jgi:hypothetical protein
MLEQKEHDFEIVASGSAVIHRFPVKNIYKHEIELLSVRSSCGCTTAMFENEKLRAGAVGHVVATFNTTSHSGHQRATITLEVAWNDNGVRRTGEAQLQIEGTIRGDVTVEPESVSFLNVPYGSPHEQRLRISSEGRRNWRVKNVQCNCENVEFELCEACRSSDRVAYDLLVRLTQYTAPGSFRGQLVLITDDESRPRIPVYISGRVITHVTVAPEHIFFGEVEVGRQIRIATDLGEVATLTAYATVVRSRSRAQLMGEQ